MFINQFSYIIPIFGIFIFIPSLPFLIYFKIFLEVFRRHCIKKSFTQNLLLNDEVAVICPEKPLFYFIFVLSFGLKPLGNILSTDFRGTQKPGYREILHSVSKPPGVTSICYTLISQLKSGNKYPPALWSPPSYCCNRKHKWEEGIWVHCIPSWKPTLSHTSPES